MITTRKRNIFQKILLFQFFDIPKKILKIWKSFLVFNLNYFSAPLLLKTYFSYWRGYRWYYGRGFDFGRYLEAFFSNLVSRLIGAFLRTFLIIFGILGEILIFFLGLIFFFGWIFSPLLVIFGISYGIKFLF